MEKYLRPREFAKKHGIKISKLKNWMGRGFPYVGLPTIVLINETDGLQWIANDKLDKANLTMKEAAQVAKVSYGTIRNWKRKHPSFRKTLLINNKISAVKLGKWLEENLPGISKDMISFKVAASSLRISHSTLERWVKKLGIEYYTIGSHGRYSPSGMKHIARSDLAKLIKYAKSKKQD